MSKSVGKQVSRSLYQSVWLKDRAPRWGKHFLASALFGINKKTAAVISAAVSRETSVTIKFAGHKLPAALALGLADDDRVIILAHELLHIKESLGEGGGDGLELTDIGDDGQYGLFRALAVHVGVQAEGFNMGLLSVLKILDIKSRLPGEAVEGFLVLAQIRNVGLDDGHGIFSF